MASAATLKELFQVAKDSSSFKGISDEEVWKACQAYGNRSDYDIRIAMENIRKKDIEIEVKANLQRKKLEQSKEKMIELHEQETDDRQQDEQNAEKILEELFNS